LQLSCVLSGCRMFPVAVATHLTLLFVYLFIQPSTTMSLNRLLLLLGSWITIASAARYSAFVGSPTTSWRVPSNSIKSMEERSSLLPVPARGGSRVKGVSLYAEKKTVAKKSTKKKTTASAPEADSVKDTKPVQTFKKADFIASVAEKTGSTRAEAEDAISAVFDTLVEVRV
jgi:hypothetical protein